MIFDSEQLQYITCDTKNNLVFGSPGSGKSTALQGRIEYLLSTGAPIFSQLVITFYVTTKENLTARLGKVFGELTAFQVRTVHSVCYALIDTKDVSTSIVRALNAENAKFADYFKNISNIFIDEAQLLDCTAIDLVKKIRDACPWISVDLIGDPAQNCKTDVSCEEDEVMIQYAGHKYELLNNYRSCSNIVAFCNQTHPFSQITPMKSTSGKSGRIQLFVGTRAEQLNYFYTQLQSLQMNETIGILCSCRHPHPGMNTHIC
jgi:hypothetical protein